MPADARGYMLSDRGFFSFLVKIFVYIYIYVCVCVHSYARINMYILCACMYV